MVTDLPVELQDLPSEVVAAVGAEHADAVAALVAAAEARGITLSADALEQALDQASPFDAVAAFSPSELAGEAAAKPTWGADCGNSTFGHTCCWHCY